MFLSVSSTSIDLKDRHNVFVGELLSQLDDSKAEYIITTVEHGNKVRQTAGKYRKIKVKFHDHGN